MSPPIVFVSGATGCQGGAVARYLRSKDIQVHALARDLTSKNAHALQSIGVNLTPGDYDNKEALRAAMEGCTAIFLVLMPDFTDLTAEKRWTNNIYEAGKTAGVKHAVFSSGFGAGRPDDLDELVPGSFVDTIMRSKHAVEGETRNAGFQYWTILRPGNFMANYLDPLVKMYPGLVEQGVWMTALTRTTILPMVDKATIGRFGGEALLNPERFHEQEITYADEWLGLDSIMEKLSKATGRALKANYLSDEEVDAQKGDNPFIAGQLAMREMSRFATLDEVKEWRIPLSTFQEFLEREKNAVHETYNKFD
ncbi:hypothetical protein FZEAL_7082 [Fusarium zealandicum]|uniref:NmrA-like domain-containing protein n=1 Tax=Fusarium zealandicum TaxID=1053134 RepID=A0A8H4UH16_9HYPO|nr:hypothetical protein FZEAL_7082 [Fusarium zealandicum]